MGSATITFTSRRSPKPLRSTRPSWRSAISDRHFGVGSDGLILIMPSERADARMRMFNADGSEGEMCGNGVRCVAKYIYDHGLARKNGDRRDRPRHAQLDLEVEGGKVSRVRVDMGSPILQAADIPTLLPGDPPIDAPLRDRRPHPRAVTAVSMGNPHAVIYVDDVERFPAGDRWGRPWSTTRRFLAG